MRILKTRKLLTICALIIVGVAALGALPSKRQVESAPAKGNRSKNSDQNNHAPLALFNAAEPKSKEQRATRQARNSRYDKANWVKENPPGVYPLPLISDWLINLPALPTTQSDVVVVGRVIQGEAYLSNDKTAVYSEFTIEVEEVLKDDRALLHSNGIIAAERPGGDVQFSSGRIEQYRVANQGMPEVGRKYLFFLKRNDEDQYYRIVTGYKLHSEHVFPLDTGDQFAAYERSTENAFLNMVKESVGQEKLRQ